MNDDEPHHYIISQHEVSEMGGQPVNHINNSFNHQRPRLMQSTKLFVMDARMLQDVWRFKFDCDWRLFI